MYRQCATSLLTDFTKGYNGTILAYGQTGSGKTYTMGAAKASEQDVANQGLISRFVTDLFENLMVRKNSGELIEFGIKASYLEIYDEKVYDLLPLKYTIHDASLDVREDKSKWFAQGLQMHTVSDTSSTLSLLHTGACRRATARTDANARSSRSHALFALHLEQRVCGEEKEDVQVLHSKFTFADLAGSERVAQSGAEGQRRKEGISINQGLVQLRMVITDLVKKVGNSKGPIHNDKENSKSMMNTHSKKQDNKQTGHVNYRGSNLTKLLKDALGGNSQTLFLACVSPSAEHENETKSTLEVK